ncbi:MAG: valine--tRNA ligase [Gammaproteobacteria bacterium]|nr:valine--tRNA ligase [Gammaproteobacteria bacterium]
MDKTFAPASVEARWRSRWEQRGWFAARGRKTPYCIMLPPPNVTGTLHMGHAFQHTLMDALIRYHRMLGHDTLWQPGTDHAGIATQMVVERNLKLEGRSRLELGRDAFVKRAWEWTRHSGDAIENQIRRLGSSVDWSRKQFTLDPDYSRAVTEHFVRLYDAGLIYRGKRLVNWDPVLQTAISDLEVVQEEENGKLWHIRYPLAGGAKTIDGKDYLVVATTRPETMLGDAAVAVHPDDERYKSLVRKSVMLPLCNREIPIIADEVVDREFGTGCVKITPAHDFNDYAVGRRHRLSLISIFTKDARIVSNRAEDWHVIQRSANPPKQSEVSDVIDMAIDIGIPKHLQGLDRFDARKQIVADLEAVNLIEKIEDHKLKVPRGDRSGVVIEPYLTDQWFVDLTRKQLDDGRPGGWTAITKPALDAFADGRIRFVPENWINTYNQWLENIQDWCISRQLWWGHRIPAWYDNAGNIYVGRDEMEARTRHELPGDLPLQQDEDVFDTWFSSDIWPLATLGWPDETEALKKFYPTSVLVTGFDIIFFWVARMVMMGLTLRHEVPFREVYVHGLIRDAEGRKMSKSKGNVLDPLDLADGVSLEDLVTKRTTGLMQPETAPQSEKATRRDHPHGIEAVGVDALRFTFAALASPGRDIRFDAGRAEGYRNFCNKLWNAARFVVMNCDGRDCGAGMRAAAEFGVAERWIVSRLQRVAAEAAAQFTAYRFDLLARTLYEFVWNEYCDWYLELAKPTLHNGSDEQQRGTRRTLVEVLETALRLLHPLMPFITEEIWQRVAPLAGRAGGTIMLQPYPAAEPAKTNDAAEADLDWLQRFVLGVRQIRGEMDLPPSRQLPVLIKGADAAARERLQRLRMELCTLAHIAEPRLLADGDPEPPAAATLLGGMKILMPMAGLIDKDAELARLAKLIAKTEADLVRNQARLDSEKFLSGAPTEIVARERERVVRQRRELGELRAQRQRIDSL